MRNVTHNGCIDCRKAALAGICYKAANWQYLSDTQGHGKLDTLLRSAQPIESIWIYPLVPEFRRHLCSV